MGSPIHGGVTYEKVRCHVFTNLCVARFYMGWLIIVVV